MSDRALTVVKLYGVNLGPQQDDLQEYWELVESKHPAVRFGWFGKLSEPVAMVYHRFGYHEMYDDGAMNKDSMVVYAGDMVDFVTTWDRPVMSALEDMGFEKFGVNDVNWMVVVTEFKPALVEEPLAAVGS